MGDDWPYYLVAFFLFLCGGFLLVLCGVGGVLSIRLKTSSKLLGLSPMPNPLSRVKPDASVWLGNAGHRALATRPHLAILAMEAIGSSSNVENFLLKLFIQ